MPFNGNVWRLYSSLLICKITARSHVNSCWLGTLIRSNVTRFIYSYTANQGSRVWFSSETFAVYCLRFLKFHNNDRNIFLLLLSNFKKWRQYTAKASEENWTLDHWLCSWLAGYAYIITSCTYSYNYS